MRIFKKLFLVLIFGISLIGLGACPDDGAMEETGEEIDEAVEDTGDAMEDAADDAGDAMEDAGDEMEDAVDQ